MDANFSLKKAGLKATLPRLKILNLFLAHESQHMNAEDVYRALLSDGNEIGLATVYRVLTQFEQAGLIVRHHFEGGKAVFEANRGTHHDHLVCLDCGHVEEYFDETIEARQKEVARQLGFEVKDHVLYIYANCKTPNCPHKAQHEKQQQAEEEEAQNAG